LLKYLTETSYLNSQGDVVMDIDEESVLNSIRDLIAWSSKLNTLLYLELVFKPFNDYTYLHISGEKDSMYIPVYRVRGEPYIPISSIYGALRHIAEAVARSSLNSVSNDIEKMFIDMHCKQKDGGLRHICSNNFDYLKTIHELIRTLFEKGRDIERYFVTQDTKAEIFVVIDKALQIKNIEAIPSSVEPLLSFLCPICRLFGGLGMKSMITLLDVKIVPEAATTQTQTSINRSLGIAHTGYLYSTEYIALNELKLKIIVRNIKINSIESKILKALLTYLKDIGISIGGRKTLGLGRLKVDPDKSTGIYINLNTINNREELIKTIIAPETLTKQHLTSIINMLDTSDHQ